MPNRTRYPVRSMHNQGGFFVGSIVGNGTSAPTVPTTTPQDQFVSSCTRSGVGTYAVVLKEHHPRILYVGATLSGTDGKLVQVVSFVESTKTVNLKVRDTAGTDDDIESTDTIRLLIVARESTV